MARRDHVVAFLTVFGGGLLLLLAAASARPAYAVEETPALKVPRFVSVHSDKVNLRTGPGLRYPIEWVLTKKDMPLEVIAQFNHWRHVREWDGTEGWVQEHMVTLKRYVVVDKGGEGADRPVYTSPDTASGLAARAEPGAVARLLECHGAWCRIEADGITGWMPRSSIWGVFPDETVP